jgi:hypothetical protein
MKGVLKNLKDSIIESSSKAMRRLIFTLGMVFSLSEKRFDDLNHTTKSVSISEIPRIPLTGFGAGCGQKSIVQFTGKMPGQKNPLPRHPEFQLSPNFIILCDAKIPLAKTTDGRIFLKQRLYE